MSFLANKKSTLKTIQRPAVRTETVAIAKPRPKAIGFSGGNGSSKPDGGGVSRRGAGSSSSSAAAPGSRNGGSGSKSASPFPSSSSDKSRKRKAPNGRSQRDTPASDAHVTFDPDSEADDNVDDDWEDRLDERKRRKHMREKEERDADRRVDPNRKLRHPALAPYDTTACVGENGKRKEERLPKFVHAADIVSLEKKCSPIFAGAKDDELVIELQYPGSLQRERYELVQGRDKMDVVNDIKRVVKNVLDSGVYLTDSQADDFSTIIKDLERTSKKGLRGFKAALDEYNKRLLTLLKDGSIAKNLDKRHEVPSNLVALILNQGYDRIVAPEVDLLRRYENGSDNVYGELKAPFCTHVLAKELKMTSDQVFVDLGSGVGNVVLHAALEIGCESWGCEIGDKPAQLAEKQRKEFKARCQLWGLAPGRVVLKEGDLRTDAGNILKRADVVLVNNKVFSPELNNAIVQLFLDLKPGCKIISLQDFVRTSTYNENDIASSILQVEEREWSEGWVSWTSNRGEYFIATKV